MEKTSHRLVPELSVSNFAQSLDFYTRVLGFSIAYQRDEDGFAFLTLVEACLMIDTIGQGRTWNTGTFEFPLGRGINLQIEVESLDPLLARLHQAHIPLFLKVEERWYRKNMSEVGQRQFLVQDPDGYLLRFMEHLGERPLA